MPSNSPQKRLFVGSLPYSFTDPQLLSLFTPFGPIVSSKIIYDKWGKSRGLGYVEYEDLESAIKAQRELHGYALQTRTIIVDFAKPDPLDTQEGRLNQEMARERHFQKSQRQENRVLRSQEQSEQRPLPHKKNTSRLVKNQESQSKPEDREPSSFLPPATGKGFEHPKYKSKYAGKKGHLRESVFKQRYFGSKQGKKFAKKTKKKKS